MALLTMLSGASVALGADPRLRGYRPQPTPQQARVAAQPQQASPRQRARAAAQRSPAGANHSRPPAPPQPRMAQAARRPSSPPGQVRRAGYQNNMQGAPSYEEVPTNGSEPTYTPMPDSGFMPENGFVPDSSWTDGGWTSGCEIHGPSCYGDCCAPGCFPCLPNFYAGAEFVVLLPRFENNPAYTTTTSDDVTFQDEAESSFTYDMELGTRAWIGYVWESGLGMRAAFFHLDHDSDAVSVSPTPGGFSTIAGPFVFDSELVPSTSDPTDVFSAISGVEVLTVDWEATKAAQVGAWAMMIGGGLRYASVEQFYDATIRASDGTLLSSADSSHRFDGVGPTVSLQARRPLLPRWQLFTMARGSLVFGAGKMSTTIGTDLDLSTPFTITQSTDRDDLMPMAEAQFGAEYSASWLVYGLFFRIAMEGQLWQGAGGAANEDGDLGFFGLSTTVGMDF